MTIKNAYRKNKKRFLISFFFIGIFVLASNFECKETFGAPMGHLLAYSKKNSLKVMVDSNGKDWCSKTPTLRIFAKDKVFFNSSTYANLMKKLGKILDKKCPKVLAATIYGYENQNKSLVYQATAESLSGWKPHIKRHKSASKKLEKTQEKETVTYNNFSVNGWEPIKLGEKISVIGKDVFEHILKTEDGKCAIRYGRNRTKKEMNGWHITVRGNPCYNKFLSGKASIQVLTKEGKIDGEGTGYFTDGYFTLEQRWNVPLMTRYAFGKEHQLINFFIDSDYKNKIHYVGYLRSDYKRKYGKYTKWHGCNPFMISAVTENENLFLNDDLIQSTVKKAEKYANLFCPNSQNIHFFATTKPFGVEGVDKPISNKNYNWQKNPNLLFEIQIKKNKTGKWAYSLDKAKNAVKTKNILKIAENRKRWKTIKDAYDYLEKLSFIQRLSYLHDGNKIDNLTNIITTSKITKKPIKTTLLINIKKEKSKNFKIAFPNDIFVEKNGFNLENGWQIITGKIISNDNKTTLIPEKITKCKKNKCKDGNDILSIVRNKFSDENWSPTTPPKGFE
jgi:hypothetical protein